MIRFLFPRAPKSRAKKNLAIDATNFCQIDPKMMRFSNSPSAEGASEENLAICATNFCQVDPKMMRFLIPREPKARAKKIWRLMRRISAKETRK